MLLHLGGQDTITAYAVQDNDLWLRHLLRLLAQSGVVIYVLRTSWKGNWLSILSILMFLAGVIKYAERIWVMRSANHTPKFDKDKKGYGPQMAFKTIEIELGHAYDAFYTKIPLFLTGWGGFFRITSFCFTYFTSVFF
ncbi:hypothetical protein FCV25MIE_27647 [Fagus crenata]